MGIPNEHQLKFNSIKDAKSLLQGFKDLNFPDIVYTVEKALYGLHQAPKACSTKKELCNEFEKLMHEKIQMSSMGELTFFLGLQVKQKKDGIFISQDKYVVEILKKFGFTEAKTASTPMETQKPLLKDEDGEEVDVHLYRLVIGSLMYLTSSRFDIMFAVCACARYQINPKVSHLHAVKRIFSLISWQCKKQTVVVNSTTEVEYVAASSCCGQVLWIQIQLLDYGLKLSMGEVQLQALVDGKKIIITESTVRRDLQLEDAEGVDYLPNATIFEQLTLMGPKTTAWNEFSSNIAYAIICLATSQEFNFSKLIFENEAVNEEMDDSLVRAATTASSLEAEQDSGSGLRCQETIKDTITQTRFENVSKTSNDSLLTGVNTPRSDEDSLKLKELMEFCTKFQQRVLDLENIKTAQAQEIISLKLKVKKLEKKGGLRTHKLKRLYKVGRFARVISSNEASLGNQEDASKQGRQIDDIDKDAEITLVNETQGRYGDEEMFDTGVLDDEEVFAGHDMAEKVVNVAKKEVSTADPVTTAGEVVTTASVEISTAKPTKTTITDDLTLAETLIDIRSAKPKVKGVVIGE
ncbi:retrovirus-related pol polyprotein from transposon TNT 1-94 [Tanacetum coccineum]|uniref:Retrovirus-related pol polyprotein from transposon TNT 1-94 n=1 Tax=Tanacetum coccineum TaxID=301880 RepID=A0ABQ4WJ61_9ASTR